MLIVNMVLLACAVRFTSTYVLNRNEHVFSRAEVGCLK